MLSAWPSTSRAPTARAAVRASLAHVLDSSNLAPSIRIWARPAIARARATDGRLGRDEAHGRRGRPRCATSPWPAIQAQRPSRSLSRLGARRVRRLVDELDRRLDQGDGAGRVVEAGDAGRPGQELDAIVPDPGLGVGDLAPQLERPLVLGERLREGVAAFGGVTRDRRGLEGARQVVRGIPVVGQLGRAGRIAGRARLERPGECRVESRALPGQQVVVDRLLEQGVAEGVALDGRPTGPGSGPGGSRIRGARRRAPPRPGPRRRRAAPGRRADRPRTRRAGTPGWARPAR